MSQPSESTKSLGLIAEVENVLDRFEGIDGNRLAAAEVVNAVILPALEAIAASLRSSLGGAA